MKESNNMRQILLDVSSAGYTFFRNNVGRGWVGTGPAEVIKARRTVSVNPGDVVLRKARPLHAGLCEGSSDLIGACPVTITPDMVGKKIAVFGAVEVKTKKGRLRDAQRTFLDFVNRVGGIGIVARSSDEAIAGLREHEFH